MILCGIDPGTRIVGVGFVDDSRPRRLVAAEAIRLDIRQALAQRLGVIEARLHELFEMHRPEAIAIERVFQGRNVASLIGLGEGRGVALLAAGKRGIPIHEYTPSEVKKSVTGAGHATKSQVARWVRAELAGIEKGCPLDVTDALAIALCLGDRLRRERLTPAPREDQVANPMLALVRRGGRRGRGR